MALLSGVRGTSARDAPANVQQVLVSRLLPQLYDARRLESRGRFSVLDFGRASPGSFDFFNQYPCRLSVLDAGASLLNWSRPGALRAAATS